MRSDYDSPFANFPWGFWIKLFLIYIAIIGLYILFFAETVTDKLQ